MYQTYFYFKSLFLNNNIPTVVLTAENNTSDDTPSINMTFVTVVSFNDAPLTNNGRAYTKYLYSS